MKFGNLETIVAVVGVLLILLQPLSGDRDNGPKVLLLCLNMVVWVRIEGLLN